MEAQQAEYQEQLRRAAEQKKAEREAARPACAGCGTKFDTDRWENTQLSPDPGHRWHPTLRAVRGQEGRGQQTRPSATAWSRRPPRMPRRPAAGARASAPGKPPGDSVGKRKVTLGKPPLAAFGDCGTCHWGGGRDHDDRHPGRSAPRAQRDAASNDDTGVKLWDASTGRLRTSLAGYNGGAAALAFSPDGSTLATGSAARGVELWDASTGDGRRNLPGFNGKVHALVFSPDGRILATGGEDWTVHLLDPLTGRSRGSLSGHTGAVVSAVFSPDGRVLATGGEDGTVRLWDTDNIGPSRWRDACQARRAHRHRALRSLQP